MSAGLPAVAWGATVGAPSISAGPAASSYSNSSSATFSFSSSTSGASYTCQLDAATAASCTSGKQYTSLSEGQHTFKVYASKSGSTTSSTTQRIWTVDTVAPATATVGLDTTTAATPTYDQLPSSYIPGSRFSNQNSFTVTYSGESGATFMCYLSTPGFNGPMNFQSSNNGRHLDIANYTTCGSSPITVPMATGGTGWGGTTGGGTYTDGQYFICVKQVDAAGNASTYPSLGASKDGCVAVVRDTVTPGPPTISATYDYSPIATGYSTSKPSKIEMSPYYPGGQPESGYFYRSVDGGPYVKVDWTVDSDRKSTAAIAGLKDGGHVFSFKLCDLAVNCSSPQSFTFYIDTTAPNAPLFTSLPGTYQPQTATRGSVNSTSATIRLQPLEMGGTVECRLDSGPWGACMTPSRDPLVNLEVTFAVSGLSEGTHTVSARQTDAAGNVGAVKVSEPWTVDVTAPAAPTSITGFFEAWEKTDSNGVPVVRSGAYKAVLAEPMTVNYPDSYASRLQCQTDSGAWGSCVTYAGQEIFVVPGATTFSNSSNTYAATPAGLSDGLHRVSVRQIDAAGNVGAAKAQNFIIYSATPPAPNAFTGVPTSDTSDTSVTIGFTVPGIYGPDYGDDVECQLDNGRWNLCTSFDASTSKATFKASSLSLGTHTLTVGYYMIGQWSEQATATWKVIAGSDTTAPAAPTQFTGVPSAPTNSTSATIGFTLAESDGTVECKLDSGTWGACTSVTGTSGSKALTGLADGSHVLSARQTDAAGNVGATGSTATWVVDTVAPVAPALSGVPSGLTVSTGASIGFTGEAGASFTCSVDGGSYSSCSSPKALSGLSLGDHSIAVKATDAAGNTSSAATAQWTVVPPVVPTPIAPPVVVTPASGSKTVYKRGSKWAIKVGSMFSNGGDSRGGAQLLTVQVAVNGLGQPVSARPSDSEAKPSAVGYLNGVVAWDPTGEVLRQSFSRPVWVRVGNKAGKWTGWVKLTA